MNETSLLRRDIAQYVALGLLASVLAWTFGFTSFVSRARAANLTTVSDTISNSDLGVVATHTIQYTNGTTTVAGQTIRVTFDPTTDRFGGIGSVVNADVQTTGMTLAATCGAPASEVTLTTSTAAGDESIILTVCSGDTIATGTKTVVVSNKLTNPTTTSSYVIRIAGTQENNADTRVAIIDNVVVTAAVDTSFTFTIAGVSSSVSVHPSGVTTTVTSTATTIPFGTLPLNTPVTMAQKLTVATNAKNGFIVTVKEDQNLLSTTGADIDLFRNGESTATPIPWVAPSSTLDVENTYGHIGLTSNDTDLNSGEFGTSTANYAGNFNPTSSRQVFSHTGPSDGTTQDKGIATVAYRIQIGALQEAANDYTNTLTYVATPTF